MCLQPWSFACATHVHIFQPSVNVSLGVLLWWAAGLVQLTTGLWGGLALLWLVLGLKGHVHSGTIVLRVLQPHTGPDAVGPDDGGRYKWCRVSRSIAGLANQIRAAYMTNLMCSASMKFGDDVGHLAKAVQMYSVCCLSGLCICLCDTSVWLCGCECALSMSLSIYSYVRCSFHRVCVEKYTEEGAVTHTVILMNHMLQVLSPACLDSMSKVCILRNLKISRHILTTEWWYACTVT